MSVRRLAMIAAIARLLEGCRHVCVGAASPLPAAGALLARALSEGAMRVSLLGSESHNGFTDGGRELFDCAAQGRIDAFFLSGAQIDGSGNVNLLGLGPRERVTRRFNGNFGSAYLAFLIPHLILFKEGHSRKTLVPSVDFISAPGTSPPDLYRPGGPRHLVTDRCVFDFDGEGFVLRSIHDGESVSSIVEQTGFGFERPPMVPATAMPDARAMALIEGPVMDGLRAAYPRFAEDFSPGGAGAAP